MDDLPVKYVLRSPCKTCKGTLGRIEEKNGQDTTWCLSCGEFQYNAPRAETGKPVRHVRTRENISPSLRTRVFLRDNNRCVLCGKSGYEISLHVGHLLSVKAAAEQGITESEATTYENLAAMCDECNLGLGDESVPLPVVYRIFKARKD